MSHNVSHVTSSFVHHSTSFCVWRCYECESRANTHTHTRTMFGRTNYRQERQNSIYHLWKHINTEWNDFWFVWPIHLLFTNHFSRKQKMKNTLPNGGERNKSSFINCQKGCRYHCCCCCLNPFAICAREKGRKSKLLSQFWWCAWFVLLRIANGFCLFKYFQLIASAYRNTHLETANGCSRSGIHFIFHIANCVTNELMARQTNYSIRLSRRRTFCFVSIQDRISVTDSCCWCCVGKLYRVREPDHPRAMANHYHAEWNKSYAHSYVLTQIASLGRRCFIAIDEFLSNFPNSGCSSLLCIVSLQFSFRV